MTASEVERLATLEEKARAAEDDIHEMRQKIDEMHAIIMQAKGARWALMAMAAVGGGIAGFAAKFLPFFRT